MANPAVCPSAGDLERLLTEDLSGPDRDRVESHVEACGSCQERLARLSEPDFRTPPHSGSGTEPGPEPDAAFLHRLRELPRRTATQQGPATRFPGGRLGRYEVLGPLGTGGMGAVYKARHVELGKVVALKVLPAGDLSEVSLARFKNEMRAIGRLHHPHIVAAHDAGDVDGVHYLAMELVEGLDLARLVRRHGRLSVPDACEAARQAALGLQHAFEKGLVHRDVKPSNLMLARGGLVQVLDLGLARACEDAPSDRLTSKGALLGTADYLAPEQWEHPHAADTRADIYGLGCTLYHLLAGDPPFAGEGYTSVLSRLRAHQEEPPPPIADVPAGLAAVLGRMLAKAPAARFQTPAEVAEALRPFAVGADLSRLLDATEPLPAPDAAVTPGPGKLDTAPGSRRPAPRRRYAVPVAVAVLGLVLVATFLWWPKREPTPKPEPLAVTGMRVTAYRDHGQVKLGDLRTSNADVRVNDGVAVAAEFNAPAYYYLIAFNPAGSPDGPVQLCSPKENAEPAQQPALRFPPDDALFIVDAPGLQVFVLAVSKQPLPPFRQWRDTARDLPWTGAGDAGKMRWHSDGGELVRLPQDRGTVVGAPKSLAQLRDWFRGRPEFDVVQIFAFPVADRKDPVSWSSPTPPPQPSKDDTDWVMKTYERAVAFGRQGKWGYDEAQAPVREILDLCTRKLGKDHYWTEYYRREIDLLQKLAELSEDDRLKYMKTYPLGDEMNAAAQKGEYARAIAAAEEILAIYRHCLGPGIEYEAMVLIRYGQFLRETNRYPEAEAQFRAALKICLDVPGEDCPRTVQAYNHLGLTLGAQGRLAEVRDAYQSALTIARRVLGDVHPLTSVSRGNLATWFDREALPRDSEGLHRQATEALRAAGEEYRSLLATSCNNLGLNLHNQARYAEAEELYQEALRIWLKAPKPDPGDTGRVYLHLAANRDAQGDVGAAEALYRRGLADVRTGYGDASPNTAWALNNLAVNLNHQGKHVEAEGLLREALAIILLLPGDQGQPLAKMSNNLAQSLRGQKRYADARAECEKALAALRERLAPDHPDLGVLLNSVAAVLHDQGRYADAEPYFREDLTILAKRLAEGHPDTALAHTNLAVNLYYQGRFAEADPHLHSALDAQRKVLGEGHPSTASTYKNLIGNACAAGEYDRAAGLAAAATDSFEAARVRLSHTGLDRAGSAAEISPYPGLAVVAARRGQPALAWMALERNLARGLLDDLAGPTSEADRQREHALLGKLDLLDRRVDVLRAHGPKADADRRKAEADREAAQAELAQFRADVTAKSGTVAGRVYELADVQRHLPDGTALVAWLDLPLVPNWRDPRGDHWACVVKRTGDPVWVQLRGTGPAGAWTEEDDRLAARFRGSVSERQPKEDWKDLKDRLVRQRLGPLGDRLTGVRHLVVLPSSGMAGVPVEALTGRTVSYAPSGTMFAWLRERRAAATARPANHLLSLGDPAYPKGSDAPAALPGSRQELAGIGRVFDRVSEFKGSDASEQTLDQLVAEPGGLRRFGYLHFATHAVVDDRRPLRSALLLAQDRLPDPVRQALDGKAVYDGRLTAERILRRWNRQLDAELVTLSACQTGLGTYSGGEGYLGFSQALFLAGARSLVLSLWEVDDTATALLMTRFYENLMGLSDKVPGGPVKPLPKAEALAEAKRWLQTLTPDQAQQLSEGLPRQGTRGDRGRVVKKGAETKAGLNYEHPYYWSGFVLVGDVE